ncbi:hypothetical protein LNP25_11145 [Klebsiella variicola subsp. variicola]|nr:hypothetical protein [Klebsiella variicola subsp. variicola]
MVTSPAAGPLTAKGGAEGGDDQAADDAGQQADEGGKPLAWAMPRHSGRATRKTTMPARES